MSEKRLREHRKSRLGCLVCKARKIKCDERHPLCSNCAKRFPGSRECYYAPPISWVKPQAATAPVKKTNQSSRGSSMAPDPATKRVLEIQIWNHYLQKISLTLPPKFRPELRSVWTEELPGWAYDHEYLMDGTLGLTAINLYVSSDSAYHNDRMMLAAAYDYYANAASKYRKALEVGINASNAAALLATAFFIGFQTKIVPRLHAADNNEPYSLPVNIFQLQRGIPTTYQATLPYLHGHRLTGILSNILPTVDIIAPCTDPSDLPLSVHQDAMALLTAMSTSKNPLMADPDKFACERTFAYVLNIHRSLERDSPSTPHYRRCVPAFYWEVPYRFIELLEQENPIAMLILARYFAISRLGDDLQWWVCGLAEREVVGIESLLPEAWLGFMAAPKELMGETTESGPFEGWPVDGEQVDTIESEASLGWTSG